MQRPSLVCLKLLTNDIPLNKQLKKGELTRFELNDKERQRVDELKEKITTTPVPALSRPEGQFVIETDACDKEVGCVLLH